jgi:hypothetical protein
MTALNVDCSIDTLKVGATAFVINATSIRQSNKKGPFRLISVHVELLSFFLGDIVFHNMWFSIIQLQLLLRNLASQAFNNVSGYCMDWMEACLGQKRVFSASQGLFGIRIRRVLSSTYLFANLDDIIALIRRQSDIGNVDVMFVRDSDPIDHLYEETIADRQKKKQMMYT